MFIIVSFVSQYSSQIFVLAYSGKLISLFLNVTPSPLDRQQIFQDYKSLCLAFVAIKLKKLHGLRIHSQLVCCIRLNVYRPESTM